ncbi:MAG: hypothetical protein RRA15_06295 [bacterium]|nr:hypothetical protein [bacterium]MDT8366085.1 hypothetical protein [bacterium]
MKKGLSFLLLSLDQLRDPELVEGLPNSSFCHGDQRPYVRP